MNTITKHYLSCLAWTATDEEGESLDHLQFSNEAELKAEKEVNDFVELIQNEGIEWQNYMDDEQFGHDFALTRNGHGAGFWDRGLGELGTVLSDWARTYGSTDVYLNKDTMELEIA